MTKCSRILIIKFSCNEKVVCINKIHFQEYFIHTYWILWAFLLVAIYDLLEDRCTNDITVNFFSSLLYKANRFYVAVHLFSNRSQKMSKCGKNYQWHNSVRARRVSLFVLTTFWHHLWPIAEQTHGFPFHWNVAGGEWPVEGWEKVWMHSNNFSTKGANLTIRFPLVTGYWALDRRWKSLKTKTLQRHGNMESVW